MGRLEDRREQSALQSLHSRHLVSANRESCIVPVDEAVHRVLTWYTMRFFKYYQSSGKAPASVLHCLLHMPQLLPKSQTFAILYAVLEANSTWGMCSKHCNTMESHSVV